ncbi:MAG: hypothetical protein U9N61_08105 [Euryarchaeota archaeon]|nr:hypothetical protein [Euryarchaeota archaeon]
MTEKELVRMVEVMPAVRALDMSASEKKKGLQLFVGNIANEVAMAFDWDFTMDQATETMVADTADYILRGNNDDCRDIIIMKYKGSDDDTWYVLKEKSPVDMDHFLSERSVDGVGWWTIKRRTPDKAVEVTLYDTPGTTGDTLSYRYRRSDVPIGDFPDGFSGVLVSALAAKFLPSYRALYRLELNNMIDRYKSLGGSENPARLDRDIVTRNNEKSRLYGY